MVRPLLYRGYPVRGRSLPVTGNTPLEPEAIAEIAAEEKARLAAIELANRPPPAAAAPPRSASSRCRAAGGRWTGNTSGREHDSYRGIRGCRSQGGGGGGGGGGTCVPGETRIRMANNSWKRIDKVLVGEMIQGRTRANKVLAYDRILLSDHATPRLYEINGMYQNTDDHLTLLNTGWAVLNKTNYRGYNGQVLDCVYDADLNPTPMLFKGIPEDEVSEYKVGSDIAIGILGGHTKIESIREVASDPTQTVYSLVADGDGTMMVSGGYILSAWTDSDKWGNK